MKIYFQIADNQILQLYHWRTGYWRFALTIPLSYKKDWKGFFTYFARVEISRAGIWVHLYLATPRRSYGKWIWHGPTS